MPEAPSPRARRFRDVLYESLASDATAARDSDPLTELRRLAAGSRELDRASRARLASVDDNA